MSQARARAGPEVAAGHQRVRGKEGGKEDENAETHPAIFQKARTRGHEAGGKQEGTDGRADGPREWS